MRLTQTPVASDLAESEANMAWSNVYGNRKTRKVKLAHVLAYDAGHSLARSLEMAVDSASPEQGLVMQFFADCRTYNLVEATIYLENWLLAHGKLEEKLSELNAVKAKVEEIVNLFNLAAL